MTIVHSLSTVGFGRNVENARKRRFAPFGEYGGYKFMACAMKTLTTPFLSGFMKGWRLACAAKCKTSQKPLDFPSALCNHTRT